MFHGDAGQYSWRQPKAETRLHHPVTGIPPSGSRGPISSCTSVMGAAVETQHASCCWNMRFFVALVLAALSGGCGGYFAPDRNISDRIEESVVLGTWRLTARSLELLKRDGLKADASHKYLVTLNIDHTCEFASVLDSLIEPTYVAMPCRWTLEHDTAGDSNVRKANALRLEVEAADANHTLYLNFARERDTLILWNYLGDPDLWEFVEYSRANDTTSE
jgi:hypothetical protein